MFLGFLETCNFQSSKKANFDFYYHFVAFIKEQIFKCSYSIILEVITSFTVQDYHSFLKTFDIGCIGNSEFLDRVIFDTLPHH
jgi:hypothetical protein